MSITEDELKERAVAPRVTLEQVYEAIEFESYMIHYELTICVLKLKNGFLVTGQSACADPANYQADIGQRIAKADAINKIWPLLGYELRTKLALLEQGTAPSFPEEMRTFIGTKVVHATLVTREEWSTRTGYVLPKDGPHDIGYLVEYADGGKSNVEGFTGYVSWSPKDIFEKAYRAVV